MLRKWRLKAYIIYHDGGAQYEIVSHDRRAHNGTRWKEGAELGEQGFPGKSIGAPEKNVASIYPQCLKPTFIERDSERCGFRRLSANERGVAMIASVFCTNRCSQLTRRSQITIRPRIVYAGNLIPG